MKTIRKFKYSYALINIFKKETGCIEASYGNNELQIIRFGVCSKYRGNKKRYGKQLLDCIIKEAKDNGITRIFVTPKAEKYYDDTELMELNTLYTKYKNLGFKFINDQYIKEYDNIMFIDL